MDDRKLLNTLHELGVDQESYPVLALLPLVQVAWADGRIQPKERALILDTAEGFGLSQAASRVLDSWLVERPAETTYVKARRVLLALVRRRRGIGADIRPATLAEIVDLCEDVAKTAGGLFDRVYTVDRAEREAIHDIAQMLHLGPEVDWSKLAAHGD